MTEVLLDYIKTCREAGLSNPEIAKRLVQVGWPKVDIREALGVDFDIEIPPPPSFSRFQKEIANTDVIVPDKKKWGFSKLRWGRKANTGDEIKASESISVPVVKTKSRGHRIWRTFEMVQKTVLVVAIMFGTGYGFYRLLNLKESELEFERKMDQQRVDNFNSLKDKVVAIYGKTRKLPDKIENIDSKGEFSRDPGTDQIYDYKKITVSSFQFCTIFNLDSESSQKGYTCYPYELNAMGVASAGLPFNPVLEIKAEVLSGQAQAFEGCTNPQPLLANNQRCVDPQNCRKPMFTQQFGMSSVAMSNSKDRIAQTFKLPKDLKAGEVTEISPWFITFSGSSACMAIYEMSDETDPLSGQKLAEYKIDISNLKKEAYNPLYIEPIKLTKGKTYSAVFSVLDDNSFVSFARGMENADYYEGTAIYLKRPLVDCVKGCEPVKWTDRQDDIKFGIKFF